MDHLMIDSNICKNATIIFDTKKMFVFQSNSSILKYIKG